KKVARVEARERKARRGEDLVIGSSISSINPSIISLSSTRVVTIKAILSTTSSVTISNTSSSKDVKGTMEEMDQATEVDGEVEELDEEITVEGGMEGSVVVPRGVVVGRDELGE
ncbi:hypothetical protein N0V85_009918, partial [Neurospora sp. IMI 360204]